VSYVDKDKNGKPWGIDAPNKEKETPLMRVVEKCNYELIEFLIRAGANLHAIDKKGDTSFHYAARLHREKKRPLEWPNRETAPEIFKVNNCYQPMHFVKLIDIRNEYCTMYIRNVPLLLYIFRSIMN
jgi:hypothetical protein